MTARWPVGVAWLLTRAAVVWLLCTRERSVVGDVEYYQRSLEGISAVGVAHTLVEYPVPALGLLALPWGLLELLGRADDYVAVVAALALVTDAAYMVLLVHARRWSRHDHMRLGITPAEWLWLLAVPAMGATTYARFDLTPGVLVGVAVLYAAHRPAFAGMVAAVATGLKYWPVLVVPALAAPRDSRRKVLLAVAACGGLLALASLVAGGWARLFTPFTWQGDRGLQIESVAATPAMIGWALGPEPWSSAYTQHNAWEIFGPGVWLLLQISRAATIGLAVLLGLLFLRAWRRLHDPEDPGATDAVVWICLTAVSGFVVTSKVFSPQYLLWLLPAAAAGLLVVREAATWRRLLRWAAALLLAAALTHPFFPLWYGPLLHHDGLTIPMVTLLALRNAIVLALFVAAAREAWRGTGAARATQSRSPLVRGRG